MGCGACRAIGAVGVSKALDCGRGPCLMAPADDVGQGVLLLVDEIRRFNRAQEDSFLPYAEDGAMVLVGATTKIPSFEFNGALPPVAQVDARQLSRHRSPLAE